MNSRQSRRAVLRADPPDAAIPSLPVRPWLTPLKALDVGPSMATTDPTGAISRYDVFQGLAEELQIHRSGVHSAKMAASLLRFEDGRDLVGVDGEQAIYYEVASRSLVAVRFDKHGIDSGSRELLQRGLDEPAAWVDAYGAELTWTHPRFG